jgi:hypothetical protein
MNTILLIYGDDDGPRLTDCLRDSLARLLCPGGEHFLSDGVLRLVFELGSHFFPAEIFSDSRPQRIETIARGSNETGDGFTVYYGCDHTPGTCQSKFNNLANFRGFPSVPPPQMAI